MKYEKRSPAPESWQTIEVKLPANDSNQAKPFTAQSEPKTHSILDTNNPTVTILPQGDKGSTLLSKDKVDKIYQLSIQGVSNEEIARIEQLSHDTVNRVIVRIGKDNNQDRALFKKGYEQLLSTAGVIATRKLIGKLDSEEGDRANIGSLAVVAGIMVDKMNSLEAKETIKTIDWNDLANA